MSAPTCSDLRSQSATTDGLLADRADPGSKNLKQAEVALQLMIGLVAIGPNIERWQHRLSTAHDELGDILHENSDLEGALRESPRRVLPPPLIQQIL